VLGERPDGILENVQPLETQAERYVVSKSNTSIRLTETDVTAIRRRDGTDEGLDTISTAGHELIEEATFPVVRTQANRVKGVADAQRRQHLEAFGYR
jgi:hypothetical protein